MIPRITLKFEPRDLWIGFFWTYSPRRDPDDAYDYAELEIFICMVPMLPIRLTWVWGGVGYGGGL